MQKPDIIAYFVWAIMLGRFCPWAILSGNHTIIVLTRTYEDEDTHMRLKFIVIEIVMHWHFNRGIINNISLRKPAFRLLFINLENKNYDRRLRRNRGTPGYRSSYITYQSRNRRCSGMNTVDSVTNYL